MAKRLTSCRIKGVGEMEDVLASGANDANVNSSGVGEMEDAMAAGDLKPGGTESSDEGKSRPSGLQPPSPLLLMLLSLHVGGM
jgi:hypothetical protein